MRPPQALYDPDYLLGVDDLTRMGGLRFKLDKDGPFLNDDVSSPTPLWAHIRELQYSAHLFEDDQDLGDDKKWLNLLIAPGSSLGGARPKANIIDENGDLWIAKFPSKNDDIDKAAWEYLACLLAAEAGVDMSPCKLEKINGRYQTFFTKRFDRSKGERIHFSSAMTMTGRNEDQIWDTTPSYLEIAEFLQYSGIAIEADLRQLWRRIVFNIAISNTDDHLRNHGFILNEIGWRLSPAYDINPAIDKKGLALNIDMDNNALDYDLAKSVGVFFHLKLKDMDQIINEVKTATCKWRFFAKELSISGSEQELMSPAFDLAAI